MCLKAPTPTAQGSFESCNLGPPRSLNPHHALPRHLPSYGQPFSSHRPGPDPNSLRPLRLQRKRKLQGNHGEHGVLPEPDERRANIPVHQWRCRGGKQITEAKISDFQQQVWEKYYNTLTPAPRSFLGLRVLRLSRLYPRDRAPREFQRLRVSHATVSWSVSTTFCVYSTCVSN